MLPEKFKERMQRLFDENEYNEFLESFNLDDSRHHALRINTLKAEPSFKDKLSFLEEKVKWEENGFYYGDDKTPGKHPYHEAGLYYIQEPSAMAPVSFLDPKPYDKVLDLCAAPGGKSTQIAARLAGEGILVTNEINRDRAKILSLNIERLGISNALVTNEDSGHLADIFEGYFDKILVDAPCSGEGMFRKNDNATDEWSEENVKACALRQREILDNAARMLYPGGRLVYSTCTFAPMENEETILRFVFDHPDFKVKKVTLYDGFDNGRTSFISKDLINELGAISKDRLTDALSQVESSIRLWPHKLKGEGHFLCVLERDGADGDHIRRDNYVPGGKNKPASGDIVKIFDTFYKECIVSDVLKEKIENGVFFMFGEQLYLADKNMPSIKSLKVLRPGLHLGTIKKDRFEPSHALALFLKASDVKMKVDFASDSDEIKSFLNGQTLRTLDKSIKGWTLITTDGYSIGWAKASNGMLKNHYPKGLRINY